MQKIFKEYTADKPNLKITLENYPFAQYFQKLTTAFAGGGAPDVMWLSVWTGEFAKRGAILPLDQYMTKEYTDDVLPIAFKECDWNGKRWAVPMHELANGLFVNKQLFEQAEITVPHDLKDAWTWDQLREYRHEALRPARAAPRPAGASGISATRATGRFCRSSTRTAGSRSARRPEEGFRLLEQRWRRSRR